MILWSVLTAGASFDDSFCAAITARWERMSRLTILLARGYCRVGDRRRVGIARHARRHQRRRQTFDCAILFLGRSLALFEIKGHRHRVKGWKVVRV